MTHWNAPVQQVDAAAEALRQYEMWNKLPVSIGLRKWTDLPNSSKRKWREKARIALNAAHAVTTEAAE